MTISKRALLLILIAGLLGDLARLHASDLLTDVRNRISDAAAPLPLIVELPLTPPLEAGIEAQVRVLTELP